MTESALVDDVGDGAEDAAVIDAGADVEDGRDAAGLADFLQSFPGVLERGFRLEQTVLGATDGVTAGGDVERIVLDEFLDEPDMTAFVGDARVGTADDAGGAAQTPGDDGVVERSIGGAG